MKRLPALLAALTLLLSGPATGQTTLFPVQVQGAAFDLNGPLFYAQDLGYFTKAGLDVHINTSQVTVEGAAA